MPKRCLTDHALIEKLQEQQPGMDSAMFNDNLARDLPTSWAQVGNILDKGQIEKILVATHAVFSEGGFGPAVAAILRDCFEEFSALGDNVALMMASLAADRVAAQRQWPADRLDLVELFSGTAAITKSAIAKGMSCRCFDLKYDSVGNDMLTATGMRRWVLATRFLKANALLWMAPVCSSWSGLCRHQSKRTPTNPMGDESISWVLKGNQQMIRCAVLGVLAWAAGADWVIEAPSGSCFRQLAHIKALTSLSMGKRTVVWLGNFGGTTPKPIQLVSSAPYIKKLRRAGRPSGLSTLATRKFVGNKEKFTGKRLLLKSSENYPLEFGRAVVALFDGYLTKQLLMLD